MKTAELDVFPGKIHKTLCQKLCPECGAVMVKADRLYENGALFVWYECGKSSCNGQWLKKFRRNVKNMNKLLDNYRNFINCEVRLGYCKALYY